MKNDDEGMKESDINCSVFPTKCSGSCQDVKSGPAWSIVCPECCQNIMDSIETMSWTGARAGPACQSSSSTDLSSEPSDQCWGKQSGRVESSMVQRYSNEGDAFR